MTLTVNITRKHQVTLPAAVRRQLAIQAGDDLVLVVQDGAIILIPVSVDPIEELRGLGRDIWDGVGAHDHLERERGEW